MRPASAASLSDLECSSSMASVRHACGGSFQCFCCVRSLFAHAVLGAFGAFCTVPSWQTQSAEQRLRYSFTSPGDQTTSLVGGVCDGPDAS